ncbi:hypothetical protein HanRHA438_Chr01g0035521 [Helianthus annuus]|uniref:Uncharacterized protein n=1 Tax=Helianthus annuus TaxID=4232 RepID=A0A251VQF7_HELAN|nr:hypothetical protein HanXRQr2_Chr01g0034711 [Helianthus annuus]KAJ0949142.1 hypothetical protein HanRHA438_Chr01g0035521 [Helianthus annuus]
MFRHVLRDIQPEISQGPHYTGARVHTRLPDTRAASRAHARLLDTFRRRASAPCLSVHSEQAPTTRATYILYTLCALNKLHRFAH